MKFFPIVSRKQFISYFVKPFQQTQMIWNQRKKSTILVNNSFYKLEFAKRYPKSKSVQDYRSIAKNAFEERNWEKFNWIYCEVLQKNMQAMVPEIINKDSNVQIIQEQNRNSNTKRNYIGYNIKARQTAIVGVDKEAINPSIKALQLPYVSIHVKSSTEEANLLYKEETWEENQDTVKMIEKIEKCIRRHKVKLMAEHSNIEIICTSPVISKNNGREIIRCPCIVILCAKKGIIPIGENHFPEELDSIPVDIREGWLNPCIRKTHNATSASPNEKFYMSPNEYHENLKIGCSIGAEGSLENGTLGGFVELKDKKIAFITCAHVLHENNIEKEELTHFNVVQPPDSLPNKNTVCGKHLKSCPPTEMDAALVEVTENRLPKNGLLTGVTKEALKDAGILLEKPLEFSTGEITKPTRFCMCIKSGATTELTSGQFTGTVTLPVLGGREGYRIERLSTPKTKMVDEGDSGSFVFQVDHDPKTGSYKLMCIGMVVYVLYDYSAVVIPIRDVLEALDIPDVDKLYVFEK